MPLSRLFSSGEDGPGHRPTIKTGIGIGNKAERALRGKQIRDARRQELTEERRFSRSAPKVIAVLAFNEAEVDLPGFLTAFTAAAGNPTGVGGAGPGAGNGGMDTDGGGGEEGLVKELEADPNKPVTFNVERHKHRFSLLVVRPHNKLAALEVIKARRCKLDPGLKAPSFKL